MRTAIILAGGESSRFGEDKALASFRGRPMILGISETLAIYCDELVISVANEEQEARIGAILPAATFVRDARRDRGPIEGFRRGFATSHGDLVLTAPCDAPLLRPRVYRVLLSRVANHEAAVPRLGVVDPLRGVYRRDAVLRVLARNASRIVSPSALVDRLDVVYVSDETLRRVDPDLRSFLDVAGPEDLIRAEWVSTTGVRGTERSTRTSARH